MTTVDADGRKIQNQITKPMVALQDALSFVVTGVVLTGQAIRNEIAIHSGVAEIDIYECAAPQIAADRKTVWARRPGEGARAYKYAWEYFTMGPGRSIARVAQKFAKNKRPLKRYSRKWQWVKRAAAYDRSIEAQKLQTAEAFEKAEAQKWAQRERNQRQRRLLLVERLIEAVETMLKVPLTVGDMGDNGRCRRS